MSSDISLSIAGQVFHITVPYVAGHQVSRIEAHVLNQAFADNIRNNTKPWVQQAIDEAKASGAQTLSFAAKLALVERIRQYAKSYCFSFPRGLRNTVDPVESEAHKLATAALREQLQRSNLSLTAFTEASIEEKIQQMLDKIPKYRELAQQRVAAMQTVALTGLAELIPGRE